MRRDVTVGAAATVFVAALAVAQTEAPIADSLSAEAPAPRARAAEPEASRDADAPAPARTLEEQVSASAAKDAQKHLFKDAVAAFDAGDAPRAMAIWKALAASGDARAMENLARLLEHGVGVPRDHAAALSWRRQAAALGLAESQRAIGDAYLLGRAPLPRADQSAAAPAAPADDAETLRRSAEIAVSWYVRAAKSGDAKAQFALGVAYWRGVGAPVDPDAARRWLERAKAAGHPRAEELLARLPEPRGDPVSAAPGEAARPQPRIIRYGAPKSDRAAPPAPSEGGPKIIRAGRPAPSAARAAASEATGLVAGGIDLSAVAHREAERLIAEHQAPAAARLYRRLADDGDAEAMRALGDLHAKGLGVQRDPVRAARLWRDAARAGSPSAAAALADALPRLTEAELERFRAAPAENVKRIAPRAPR